MNWQEFAAAAPELAAAGRERFERTDLVLVGTLRKDGWPRISPVEPSIVDGALLLGMMWRSRKALDLLRDPRLVVHSATSHRVGDEGDFKLYGRVDDVVNPRIRQRFADVVEAKINWRPKEPYHLFSVGIESAAFVVFAPERFGLRWTPHEAWGDGRFRKHDPGSTRRWIPRYCRGRGPRAPVPGVKEAYASLTVMRPKCQATRLSIHVYWLCVERGAILSRVIKGKYKNGVFEPLEPVDLPEDEMVEIVVPGKETDDDGAFLSSFGTWKDILPESFIEEVYERRVRGSRPPIKL